MPGSSDAVSLPADLPAQVAAPPASVAGRIRDSIEQGWELLNAETDGPEAFNSFRANRSKWDDHNREVLRRLFKTDAARRAYDKTGVVPPGQVSNRQDMQRMRDSVADKLALLQSILDQFAGPEGPAAGGSGGQPSAARVPGVGAGAKVLVAHAGAAELARVVAHVLEGMQMVPLLVSGAPGAGEIGPAQLDAHRDARFALVLVAADLTDAPAPDSIEAAGQARTVADAVPPPQPGALLWLGYLAGRLGRARVCALYEAKLRPPGRELGIDCIAFDASGAWTVELMQRLGVSGARG